MIYYLKGKITKVNTESVVLETGGVGYQIFCKDAEGFSVSSEKEYQFYIFEHITETSHTLYGFGDENELEMLQLLISVKGIGPKVALKILNSVNVPTIVQTIESKDPNLLPPIKSVGPKAKQRLVMELNGKIPENLQKISLTTPEASQQNSIVQESLEALISLGLTPNEANEAISRAPKDLNDSGELVKWALKNR